MSRARRTSETTPRPQGLLLVFLAACLATALPAMTFHLRYKAFSIDPLMLRAHALMSLPFTILLILPVVVLVLFLIRDRFMLPSIRTLVVLSPVLLFSAPGLAEALFFPLQPKVPFSERMGHPVPEDAVSFKAWYSHSPGESNYMFTFACSAQSTESLLAAQNYKLIEDSRMFDPEFADLHPLPVGGRKVPRGWPRPRSWDGLRLYKSEVSGGCRYLLADAGKNRVFILVGDT